MRSTSMRSALPCDQRHALWCRLGQYLWVRSITSILYGCPGYKKMATCLYHLPTALLSIGFHSFSLRDPAFHAPTDLINLTNDPHCSMATLSDLMFERLKNTSWVVVFKNLIVAHNLMTLGNEVTMCVCVCVPPCPE